MARVTIHHDVIQRMKDEMQASFDRGGALQVQVEAIGSDGFSPAGATNTAFFLPGFLLWLDRQARDQPGVYVDPYLFAEAEGLDSSFVDNLVTLLEQKRCVHVARGLDDKPDSLITPRGKAEAQALRECQVDPVARLRYARKAILEWLVARPAGTLADLADFATTRESSFLGARLSGDEISGALQYLAGKGLVEATEPGPGLRLTADGIDCATGEVSVNEYLARQSSRRDVYNISNTQGGVFGGANHTVNQTNNFGFSPGETAQLVTLAALVQQIGPTLGLPDAEQTELCEGAQALDAEATAAAPEPGRLRRAADRVMTALGGATQVTAGLTLLIENGRKAYSAVFGG